MLRRHTARSVGMVASVDRRLPACGGNLCRKGQEAGSAVAVSLQNSGGLVEKAFWKGAVIRHKDNVSVLAPCFELGHCHGEHIFAFPTAACQNHHSMAVPQCQHGGIVRIAGFVSCQALCPGDIVPVGGRDIHHRLSVSCSFPRDVWNVGHVSAKQLIWNRGLSGGSGHCGGSCFAGSGLFDRTKISEKRDRFCIKKERIAAMAECIRVENVTKRFGDVVALDRINISFESGKIYGIIGRNGSGKTVLFKTMIGYLKPTSGRVVVGEKEIGKDIDFADNMGIIIENPGFLSRYTGYKNLEYLASIRKLIGRGQIRESMERVGLDPDSRKKVGKYSLGMRQRLGIAQAIMENPDILILDEPMNGLDNQGVNDVRDILLGLKKEGKTVILASHNKEDIEVLCDMVYEMEHGRLV